MWQARYFSTPLEDAHLWAMVYVERNPVRARMVAQAEEFAWSSARGRRTGESGTVDLAAWRAAYDWPWWREVLETSPGEEDLFGTVKSGSEYAWTEERSKSKPMANVVVNAVGHHGARFSTRTDEHGAYAFTSLVSGKYRIEADLPPGPLLGQFPAYVKPRKKEGAGCRIDVLCPVANDGPLQ